MLREARQNGLATQFFAGDTASDVALLKIAGEASDGLLCTYSPPVPPAVAETLRATAKGKPLDAPAFKAYAAVEVWAAAVNNAGSSASSAVAGAMKATAVNSIFGPVSFDAKGDVVGAAGDWAWYEWRGGKMAAVTAR
jgi:branched-chain amino acid transport system substrate-binding protein